MKDSPTQKLIEQKVEEDRVEQNVEKLGVEADAYFSATDPDEKKRHFDNIVAIFRS